VLSNIETVALRIFNAYGPNQPLPPIHAPVIPQFIRQILQGGSLMVHGRGQQTRDYVYVDDVVKALAAAATAENVDRQVINIGTGIGTSIAQLVGIIERCTGNRAQTIVSPSVSGGVSTLIADTAKAEALLGFKAQVSLAEGVDRLKSVDAYVE
jgi:UDP-glucose 4-epimerase